MHRNLLLALALVIMLNAPAVHGGGCTDWRVGPLSGGQPTNGIGDRLDRAIVWDPDGGGPQSPVLALSGDLNPDQGTNSGIVLYNAFTNSWQTIANTNGATNALGIYNNELIAGGYFAGIGGATSNHIARWNGSAWQSLNSGTVNDVHSLSVHNGELVAGTSWLPNSGQSGNLVHRWTLGGGWQSVSPPLGGLFILALASYNGELVAGGWFEDGVRRWSPGGGWQAMGFGVNGKVRAFTGFNGWLVAGGEFTTADDNPANRIARWDGVTWAALGSGMNDHVECLAVYNGQLIAGGAFTTASGQPANHIARWTGSTWQSLGAGLNGAVEGMAVYNGQLYAVGDFSLAGGQPANNIARWNGTTWSPILVGNSLSNVLAMTNFFGRVVAGGTFQQTTFSGAPAHNIVAYDGVALSTFGAGMNGPVQALKAFTYPGPFGDSELIAGGNFTLAGGAGANRIARWVADPIVAFPPPQWSPMGAGFNTTVMAVERYNNETYAAGFFVNSGGVSMNRIAKWNESTDTWQAVGSGMNDGVYALKAYNGQLYAGGLFTTAGGVGTGGLARWNGAAWSQVGGNFNGIVTSLDIHNNELVIGGIYPGINSSPNLAKYNGTSYSTFGTGGTNGAVWSIRSSNGNLYIGGDFTTAGGIQARRIAVWNGATWAEVQGGTNDSVFALASFHDEVHAGGDFLTVRAGVLTSPGWAKYHETGVPWIAYQPSSATVGCGQNFAPDVQVAAGYGGLSFQWRKDGVPLSNGPTGTGSTVIQAQGNFALARVSDADEGVYDVVITNGCGSVTSFGATLSVAGDPCIGCPADIAPPPYGDNSIDVNDLLLVVANWGATSGNPADANGDHVVNVNDLLLIVGSWGTCP